MLSGQVQRRASKDWARSSMSCEDRDPGRQRCDVNLSSYPPAVPLGDWFFEESLFSYGTGSTGPSVNTGVVGSAGWKTRIVTLDQSPWQTCRRRDADPVTTLSLGGAGRPL